MWNQIYLVWFIILIVQFVYSQTGQSRINSIEFSHRYRIVSI